MYSREEGLVVCPWCAHGSFVSFSPGHPMLRDITLLHKVQTPFSCHWLMMAAVVGSLPHAPVLSTCIFPCVCGTMAPTPFPTKGNWGQTTCTRSHVEELTDFAHRMGNFGHEDRRVWENRRQVETGGHRDTLTWPLQDCFGAPLLYCLLTSLWPLGLGHCGWCLL